MTDRVEAVYPLDTGSLRDRSVRGAAVTSLAQVAKFVLMLGSQIVLARLLQPADFGIVAMVAPVLGFVAVLVDLGLLQAIVQQPVLTLRQLNSVFWINLVLSLALAAVLIGTAPLLVWFYGEPKLLPVTVALASLVIVNALSMQQSALLSRRMRFTILAISETSSLAVALAVGVLAAFEGFGYWSLIVGQAAGACIVVCIVWATSPWRPMRPDFRSPVWSMLRFGGNITVLNIAGYFNATADNMLVGYRFGEVGLGLYDRAWKLAVAPLTQLMAPLNRVAVPVLSRMADDPTRYRNAFARMTQVMLLFSLPGLAVAMVAADPAIAILFGAKWREIAPIFAWLCLGAIITPVNASISWIFVSQGRSREQMIYGSIATLINVMAYALGLRWGLVGVARTSALSVYLMQTPLLLWAAARVGPVDSGVLFRLLHPFVASTLAAAAVTELCRRTWGIDGLLVLLMVTGLAYASSAVVLALFPSGRMALRNTWDIGLVLLSPRVEAVAI